MNIKKKIVLSLFLITMSFSVFAESLDEWDMNEEFLDDFGLEIAGMDHAPTRAARADIVLGALFDQFKVTNLFKNPFYFYVHPLRRREIIDEVSLNFPRYHLDKNLSVIPFYNQMTQAQFRRDRTGIKDYVDMGQRDLINTLDTLEWDEVNIPDLLNLFANIKVQERRIGFMFQYTKDFDNELHFSCHIPLMYQEYNYFLTKEETLAIENSDFFKQFETGDTWDFVTKHLLSDKLGFGDLRLTIEKTIKESAAYRLNIGIDFSLPVSFPLRKGVIGAHFDKKKKAPSFNINDDFVELGTELENLDSKNQLLANAEALALNMLDRASTILLEHPLGNYNHPGLGLFTRSTMIFSPTVQLTSKLRVNLLVPAKERRFIKIKIDKQELDNMYNRYIDEDGTIIDLDPETPDPNAPSAAQQALDIARIESLFLEKYFPESYDVTVMPGLEISSSSQLTYERQKWIFYIGGEMWYHTKESFLKVHVDSLTLSKLELETAKKEYAYQSKTWIGVDKKKKENSNWQFGVRASASGINDGIGDDFTLTFHCVREF